MNTTPHAAAVRAADSVRNNLLVDWQDERAGAPTSEHVARYITAEYAALVEAADDAQDFLSAIVDATRGAGRIDENSILRFGERLKTTARKLDKKLRAELARVKGEP